LIGVRPLVTAFDNSIGGVNTVTLRMALESNVQGVFRW
jgi:hypothetical protein